MKLFFTLTVLFFTAIINSAAGNDSLPSTRPSPKNIIDKVADPYKPIVMRCMGTKFPGEPLLVIDGVLYGLNDLRNLNPDNIESITILKEAAVSAIYGCHAATGVIVITTRGAFEKKFIIKDFLTGEKIPAATIRFTSIKDTITAVADENGSLVIDKLKGGTEYNITVSSAGYKTFSTPVSSKQQEIFLERDVKECANVVITNPNCWRRRIVCYSLVTITKESPFASKTSKNNINSVYPNPVQRNAIFNLEFENAKDETMQLTIIGMNGTMVSIQSKRINKGLNRLSVTADPKWAAGIYNIQLRNEQGSLFRQEKLVVQ